MRNHGNIQQYEKEMGEKLGLHQNRYMNLLNYINKAKRNNVPPFQSV